MKHPPYHLRQNKAVDRILFLELLRHFHRHHDISSYVYFGLGGPFLDDIRLLTSRFDGLKAVCIESNHETHKRQVFHKNHRSLKLAETTVHDYLTTEYVEGTKSIFWLDYNSLKLDRLNEFARVLGACSLHSIVKITVNVNNQRKEAKSAAGYADTGELRKKIENSWAKDFSEQFAAYIPEGVTFDQMDDRSAPAVIQNIIRIAAQRALPASLGSSFELLQSCTYRDGEHQMLSVTGMKLEESCAKKIIPGIAKCMHTNTSWEAPTVIDLPDLSLKERLLLERFLPTKADSIRSLEKCLGYRIGRSKAENEKLLRQYKEFHQYFPMFAKVGM